MSISEKNHQYYINWGTPDDGQRNCRKHVEFLDKNKFGKISASVCFVIKKLLIIL